MSWPWVYGFIDYKTHAKVSLVIRDETKGLQTYTHLGTGNYHAQNAKIYTDLALFTNDPKMGEDVGKLFNFVTSYSHPRDLFPPPRFIQIGHRALKPKRNAF